MATFAETMLAKNQRGSTGPTLHAGHGTVPPPRVRIAPTNPPNPPSHAKISPLPQKDTGGSSAVSLAGREWLECRAAGRRNAAWWAHGLVNQRGSTGPTLRA